MAKKTHANINLDLIATGLDNEEKAQWLSAIEPSYIDLDAWIRNEDVPRKYVTLASNLKALIDALRS